MAYWLKRMNMKLQIKFEILKFSRSLYLPSLIILIWYIIVLRGTFSEALLPSPFVVLTALFEGLITGELLSHIIVSLKRVAIGYSVAVSIAILLGLGIGWYRKAELFTAIVIYFIRLIPPVAWIPFAMLWFGLGNTSCIFIISLATFFPALVNTAYGVKNVELNLIKAALTLGAKPHSWFMFKEVVFPSALPAIATGMRLSLGYAWTSLVAAEMFAATAGIGYSIMKGRLILRTDKVILGMLIIALLGFIMDKIVSIIENKLLYWEVGLRKK